MSAPLSASSLLQMLSLSGLLSDEQLRLVKHHFSLLTTDVSARIICDWLQHQQMVTEWQSEKLLQGRYRGFFLGPYRLLNRVARGGMSTIYAARHQGSGDIHALKVLPLSRTGDVSFLARFQREAQITQRLRHPHIVNVWNVYSGTDGQNSVHFMSMELLHGRDLFELVNLEGPLPWRDAAEYIRQAATGLAYAHQEGLIHRDIKPGNLFLTVDSSVKILDLGLAQDFDSEENLTREFNERVLGTADYLSPEQAKDCHTVDPRADIYSLGCTLYFLLTGQAPFTEGSLIQRLMAHQTRTPPQISQFRDDVPDDLTSLLIRMMAPDRNKRISSADEVADLLVLILSLPEDSSTSVDPNSRDIEQSVAASARSLCLSEDMPSVQQDFEKLTTVAFPETSSPARQSSTPQDPGDSFTGQSETAQAEADYFDLLALIEYQCASSDALATDPRSRKLLEFARQLKHNPAEIGNDTCLQASEETDHDHTDEAPAKGRLTPRGILLLCVILMLTAVTAALLDWTRFF